MRKEDIPVIISALLCGVIAHFVDDITTRTIGVTGAFLIGWFIRKKIKEKRMGEIGSFFKDVKDNPGYIDTKTIRRKVPIELIPLVDAVEKLLEKVQEYEIQKIEFENIQEKAKELEDVSREVEKLRAEAQSMKSKMNHLQIIHDITAKMVSKLDIDFLFDFITKMVGEKLGVGKFAILIKEGDALVVKATCGFSGNIKGMRFAPTEGVSGLAFSTGETIYIPNTAKDMRYLHWKGEYMEEGSFLSIPIKYGDEVIGLFNFNKSEIGGFSDEEIELLKKVAGQAAIAIKNAQLFKELRNLYGKEPLTGLLNRSSMIEKIEELIKGEKYFSFALFDVDSFRGINLQYGYDTGDRVLYEISEVLKKNVRRTDLISRFGGDEFAIAFIGADKKQAEDEMKKITEIIKNIDINDIDTKIKSSGSGISEKIEARPKLTVSVGISEFPSECRTSKELFEKADRKLLLAKKLGGDRIIIQIE